jgi:peptide/nickel transport system substrate-binding protein
MPKIHDRTRIALGRRTVLAGIGGSFAAASVTPAHAQTKSIDHVTWALREAVRTLDPSFANVTHNTVHSLGFESLLEFAPDGTLTPKLAESWSQLDPLTYVYKLRSGVNFWDGSPFTADDVAFSLNRVRDPATKSGWASFYANVDSIAATGPLEVTMKLKQPDPLFRRVAAFGGARIHSRKSAEAAGAQFGLTAASVQGTGPYRFTGFRSAESISVEANDKYWGTQPEVRKAQINCIIDEATRLLAMRTGEIDGTFTLSLDQADQWQALSGVTTGFAPALVTFMIMLDVTVPPYNDLHVRRAIAYSLDRAGLVQSVLQGHGQAAVMLPTPEQWQGLLSADEVKTLYGGIPGYTFDMAKARAELAQSSVPNGFKATATYPDSRKQNGLALLNLSQNLKQIGVTLEVKEVPLAQWLNANLQHTGDGMKVSSWAATSADAAEMPGTFFDSRFTAPGAFNAANYRSAEVDKLLQEQRASMDQRERGKILSQIVRQAAEDCAYVPVWHEDIGYAIGKKYRYDGFSVWHRWENWLGRISLT